MASHPKTPERLPRQHCAAMRPSVSVSDTSPMYDGNTSDAETTPTSSAQQMRFSSASSSTPTMIQDSSMAESPSRFPSLGEDTQSQIKDGITRFFYPSRNATPDRRNRVVGWRRRNALNTPEQPTQPTGLSPVADSTGLTPTNASTGVFFAPEEQEARDDAEFVAHFWRTYDDIIILSIFTQLGILFRLAASTWLSYFDGVFSEGSALFVVLPMNCMSCFILGLLCSGERLMEIVSTRFSPPRLQQDVFHEAEDHIDEDELEKQQDEAMAVAHDFEKNSRAANVLRRLRRRRRRQKSNAPRRKKTERYFHGWQPPVHLNEDLRDVQLLALERRMRASKCLVLFPVRKQDADVMEHYFRKGYKKNQYDYDYDPELNQMGDAQDLSFDLQLVEDDGSDSHHSEEFTLATVGPSTPDTSEKTMPILQSTPHPRVTETKTSPKGDTINTSRARPESASPTTSPDTTHNESVSPARDENESVDEPVSVELQHDLDQMIQDVHANITENVNRLSRVNLADGWDKGTTPDDMCDDLMLGLRDGFCGALSSFSSWESSMVGLMRDGQFGDAIVGYILGMQLPIIAYRFGQTVAVYIFIWRCRWETRRDARRGYGIRIRQEASDSDASDQEDDVEEEEEEEPEHSLPSVRAVATAIFVMALAAQVTSLKFYSSPEKQLVALSLLFSPLGVLSRWRLSKLNRWRPTFPLGTFCCNILACMLSGSLGSLLAGNPSPRQRIVLQSLVAGFGATLSSVAAFIVEVLSGVDPILFRFDGFFYAAMSVLCGMLASFLFDSTGEWVDQTESKGDVGNTTDTGLNDTQRLFFL